MTELTESPESAELSEPESTSSRALGAVTDELLGRASAESVPRTVHHYTTSSGACGILNTGTIWATDIRFLNDSSEWHHTLDITRDLLTDDSIERHESWGDLQPELDLLRGMTSYVTCFSQEQDQLSQWRAYAGQGYSLGFNFAYLMRISHKLPMTAIFAPVVYESERQRATVRAVMEVMLPLDADAMDAEGLPHRALLVGAVALAAAFFKHPDFEQEAEWRLALMPPDGPLDNAMPIRFRPLRGAVVPYCEISLEKPPTPPGTGIAAVLAGRSDPRLDEVLVGPGPDQDMAALGMTELLARRGFEASVRTSSTPYRG